MARPGKIRSLGWLVGACLACWVTASDAARPPAGPLLQPNEVKAVIASWQERYGAILVELRANDPKLTRRARKDAGRLYEEIVDRAVSGEVLCQSAGHVLTLLAIAEMRLGERDDGAWHWQMAQNVSPDLRAQEFAEFADIAPFMKESLIPGDRWGEHRPDSDEGVRGGAEDHRPEVVPPRLKKRVAPRYPAGLASQRIGEPTVVEAVIGKDGKVRQPIVRRGCGHVSLDLAAMEALKDWVYQPATLEGKPVQVFLTVTVNFTADQWRGLNPIMPPR